WNNRSAQEGSREPRTPAVQTRDAQAQDSLTDARSGPRLADRKIRNSQGKDDDAAERERRLDSGLDPFGECRVTSRCRAECLRQNDAEGDQADREARDHSGDQEIKEERPQAASERRRGQPLAAEGLKRAAELGEVCETARRVLFEGA